MKRFFAAVALAVVMAFGHAHAQCVTAAAPCLPYSGPTTATVGTTSSVMVTAGTYFHVLQICTQPNSTANVWLNLAGGTAVVGGGVPVWANRGCTTLGTPSLPLPVGPITAITDGGSSQTVALAGG